MSSGYDGAKRVLWFIVSRLIDPTSPAAQR
jgi:hypothetical protein